MTNELAPEGLPPAVREGLHWPLKWSFISYLEHLPDGASSVTDGCHAEEGRGFWFELDSVSESSLRFRGDLRFRGHHGMLFIRIADPHLSMAGSAGALSALDTSGERIDLATCDVAPSADARISLYGSNLKLTEDGASLFGGVYREGQPLDDFWITVARPTS